MEREILQYLDEMITEWLMTVDDIIPDLLKELTTEQKQNRFDLVTNVDKQLQQNFQTFLETHFPHHQLLAEEKDNSELTSTSGHLWIMDPIDGTANLVKQQEDYCIILAYFVDGEPQLSYIYDYPHQTLYKAITGVGAFANNQPIPEQPDIDIKDAILSFNAQVMNRETVHDLFQASFSYRIIGACGLDSMRVIKGQFGAHINTNPKPWDIAAQFLFAKELNLKMTSLNDEEIDIITASPFIISNPGCHQDVLNILNANGGYAKS